MNPLSWFREKLVELAPEPDMIRIGVDELASSGTYQEPINYAYHDGEKYPGGFGPTDILLTDYWTLRLRSDELFRKNLYARGLIRRLITSEINTGLTLESFPDEEILGVEEDSLTEWSEGVEARFGIWSKNPKIVDFRERRTFQQLQEDVRLEALVGGDVLVIMRQHPLTKLPQVQLVNGARVQTPFGGVPPSVPAGSEICDGVEIDANGRHVAFYVQKKDGLEYERIPAYGPRTGRKMAWLVYGTDRRMNDVRGEPILSLIMQSMKEVDRFRDAALRKAVINSIVAMSVEKGEDKPGTMPLTGGATRRDQIVETQTARPRRLNLAGHIPGFVAEELQTGEKLAVHQSGADVNFGPFEEAIIQAVAWANQIPPEILRLSFSSNYSASQAANNEHKAYLNKVRSDFGRDFCQPVYIEWLISEALLNNVSAPGLLEAWRDARQYDIFGAWVEADWSGAIKPSVDPLKMARGMEVMTENGWITNERAARELTGTKFRKNVKRIKRENQLLADAHRPTAEFEREFGRQPGENGAALAMDIREAVADGIKDASDG